MASLCISRIPATFDFHNNTPSFPRVTDLDRLRLREIRVSPIPKPKLGFSMSLTLSIGAGEYGSAASTVSSLRAMSPQTSGIESASHITQPHGLDHDGFAARNFAQEHSNQDIYEPGNGLPQSSFGIQLDPEVEALIARINRSVVIKDMATKSPQSILVPKGYLVENEIKPSQFHESRTSIKDHVKKRKREGVLPRQTKKQWRQERHGFRATEVNWSGAVHLKGCKPSNLTNDIHPIFDRSKFDDTPDSIYEQFIPGLQLATMLLTQEICMQFWATLAMGDRRNDPEMTSRNGKLSQRIENHVELTDERARIVIDHINAIGKSNLIHFRFKHKLQDPSDAESGAWGTSVPICEYQGIQKDHHGVQGDLVRSIIRIHADYYVIAEKLSQLKYPEISQKLRFSFLFAVLIVHELAHSIEGMHMKNRAEQWIDWHSSNYYKEVYWLDWQVSECGRAWEQTTFGGHIAPINNRVDGSHGIAISDWPPHGTDNDPERRVWNTISMHYIEKLFQMDTWQRSYRLSDWFIFNVPRDGATSLYINSFTTMSEGEEERVANEEMAEVIALENAQPAKKKRVKATGKTEERRPKDEKIVEEAVVEQEKQPPESPGQQHPALNDSNRATSPDALAGQRVILAPHIRHPNSGPAIIPRTPTPPPHQTIPLTPLQSKKRQPLHNTAAIYPNHGESLPTHVPKETASATIQKLKSQPKGLMAAYKQRRRLRLLKKEAELKQKRDLIDQKLAELQESLIRQSESKRQLDAATGKGKSSKGDDAAEAGRRRTEVETTKRRTRKNRAM